MGRDRKSKLSLILAILPFLVYIFSMLLQDHNKNCEPFICTSTGSAIAVMYLAFFFVPVLIASFILAFTTSECTASKITLVLDSIIIIAIFAFKLGII